MHYRRWSLYGSPEIVVGQRVPVQDRFWDKVEKTDGCWNWTAALTEDGYGRILVDGKARTAHRVSYKMHYGVDPGEFKVCHECDNPRCVRPDHLFLGSHAVNMQDMAAKGRTGVIRGADNPKSKLTVESVRQIRERYSSGSVSQPQLGREFGVSHATIGSIVRRESWAHVE